MILQALVNYYEALVKKGELAQPGWVTAKISYALNIDAEGNLLGLMPLKKSVMQGKKSKEVPAELTVPEGLKRSSGVAAQFLWDNASYFFGIDNKGDHARSKRCFAAARQRHLELLENAHGEIAKAIKNYFLKWDADKAAENKHIQEFPDILTNANLVFILKGKPPYAQEDPELQEIWNNFYNNKKSDLVGQCLVTGKTVPIAVLHPAIKGVRGGQPAGTSLVSFNAPAYESYGKEQGANAPVSEYAAFAYGTALNYLLSSEDNTTVIGDTTIVYWAENVENPFTNMFRVFIKDDIVKESTLRGVFEKLSQGEAADFNGIPINPQNKFYVLALSPNAARVSVRFFLQSSVEKIAKNLLLHQQLLDITKPAYEKNTGLPLWKLLQETANKNAKEKMATPLLAGAVFRVILEGRRYPQALLHNILLRVKADQDNKERRINKINWVKAAIIKACLVRNYKKEEITVNLNEENNNKAYVLGRLFAVLERLQKEVNPGIVSTIKDKFFNAACSTPAMIFPILIKLAGAHLKKSEYKISNEQKIRLLFDKIKMDGQPIPTRLSLEEQGIFIMGYYHQVQAFYAKKEEK